MSVVGSLEFDRRDVAAVLVEAAMVEPVDLNRPGESGDSLI